MPSIVYMTAQERHERRMRRRRLLLLCAIFFVLGFNAGVWGCALLIR
jgi:hypothetical protein